MKKNTNSNHAGMRIAAISLSIVIIIVLVVLTGNRQNQLNAKINSVFASEGETDPESGAVTYLLGEDVRPADNIYGEQPYGDPSGRRIAVRYYGTADKTGGIGIVDLIDGSKHEILKGDPPFPAFHGWDDYLYYNEKVGDKLILRRCHYLSLKVEDIAVLPTERGRYSYGTVSQDHRFYAVSVQTEKGSPSQVHLLDLKTGKWTVLLNKAGYHAKHEQFSFDGRNKVLIQLNQMPDIKQVLLAELDVNGTETLFPADRPHTPRPTGHEAWVGKTGTIFYSTASDPGSTGNIWTTKVGDTGPKQVYEGKLRFGHVSVSRCGRYWICDTGEKDIPIYIGSFATGKCKRLVFSHTEYDNNQWSHAHPYLTADNKWLIFTARRNGHPQVYGSKLKEGWLETL
jgi:Tol biopolymer transport system component